MKKILQGAILIGALLCMTMSVQAAGQIKMEYPSDAETTIASGRDFYVTGKFKDMTVEETDRLEVQISAKGNEQNIVRSVSTTIKGNQNLKVDKENGMPDLIFDPAILDSFHQGALKCYFDDEGFHALIAGGSVPKGMTDVMQLLDETGNAYTPLDLGFYIIRTVLYDKDSAVKATAEKEIEIGSVANKVLARFSPDNHKAAVKAFTIENGHRMYLDPFPGYWNFGEVTSDSSKWI